MNGVRHTLSRVITFFMIIAVVLSGCGKTETLTYEYVEFPTLEFTCYAIQGVTGATDRVTIPAEYNGQPVSVILGEAFATLKINSVSMESVLYIEPEAFSFCTRIVKKISKYQSDDCQKEFCMYNRIYQILHFYRISVTFGSDKRRQI